MYWIERLSQKWSDYLCTHGGKEQEREVYGKMPAGRKRFGPYILRGFAPDRRDTVLSGAAFSQFTDGNFCIILIGGNEEY